MVEQSASSPSPPTLGCDLLVFGMASPMNWPREWARVAIGMAISYQPFHVNGHEDKAHLTLVTSIPFDNAALHTAEPVAARRGLG